MPLFSQVLLQETDAAQTALHEAIIECKAAEEAARSKQIERWRRNPRLNNTPASGLEIAMLEAMESGDNTAEDPTISAFVDIFLEDMQSYMAEVAAKQTALDALVSRAAEHKLKQSIKQSIPSYKPVTSSAAPNEMLLQCMNLLEAVLLGQQRIEQRMDRMEGRMDSNITAADFSAERAKQEGYPLHKVKAMGYSLPEMKSAGYSCQEAKSAGYSLQEAKSAGYSLPEMKSAGYSCQEVKSAGYSCHEAMGAGYSLQEAESAGW